MRNRRDVADRLHVDADRLQRAHGRLAGLGEIVRTYTTVSRQGGQLKLVNLTKRITDLLSITKLLTVFETFDNEPEALKSFS